jgi:mono/diheme cytochrome c family protein
VRAAVAALAIGVVAAGAAASARERANPYAGNITAAAAGRKLFLRHCASCHGEGAEGTRRAPALVSAGMRRSRAGELERFLRNGGMSRGMPSWSALPEQRRWQIVTYLESLQVP